jgi:hypothetical protein
MKSRKSAEFDFEIDRLTNSIQNVISGDSFDTVISLMSINEQKLLKKIDWVFDWKKELKNSIKSVYKLTIAENINIIQGLISIEDRNDHIFMHLIESAKFNKGKQKVYYGVPGNLVAFACKLSQEMGYEGVVSFFAKTKLVDHYKVSLGAKVLFGNQMIIDELSAKKLITRYFKL